MIQRPGGHGNGQPIAQQPVAGFEGQGLWEPESGWQSQEARHFRGGEAPHPSIRLQERPAAHEAPAVAADETGAATIARLHQIEPVVATGQDQQQRITELADLGAYVVLPKPCTSEELLRQVRKALDE